MAERDLSIGAQRPVATNETTITPLTVRAGAVRALVDAAEKSDPAALGLSVDELDALAAAVQGLGADERVSLPWLGETADGGQAVRAALRSYDRAPRAVESRADLDAREQAPARLADAGGSRASGLEPRGGSGVSLRPAKGTLSGSILANPAVGGDPMWRSLGAGAIDPDDRSPRLGSPMVKDPNAVMLNAASHAGVPHAAIRSIWDTRTRDGHAAERLASELARLFGPLTAGNTPQNLAAIEANLAWIEAQIPYDHARAKRNDPDTYPPNVTLSGARGGVCRDIHLATSAIAASLVNARHENGRWVAGSPTGQEANVQNISFENPNEFHAYRVYRDPVSGKWNASEYGKYYATGANNAVDAFRSLPGYINGYQRWTIRGWDEAPAINDRGLVGGARAAGFIDDNPGLGETGETRVAAGENNVRLTHFLSPRLSVVGEIDPSALSEGGLRAGLKFNYHDAVGLASSSGLKGYTRLAGGVYSDFYDASIATGQRGADARTRYQTYVFAVQYDGRLEREDIALLDEHLKISWGVDWKARAGLALGAGGAKGLHVMPGVSGDFAKADVGGDVGIGGSERLSEALSLDWKVKARAQVDLYNVGTELITSGGDSYERSLLKDPLRTQFALSLTHVGDKVTTRFEAGGTVFMAKPYDRQTTPDATHYAALSINSNNGKVGFGLLAKGETLDGKLVPVDSLGVVLNLNPSERLSIGVGVEKSRLSVDRDDLKVMGSLTYRF